MVLGVAEPIKYSEGGFQHGGGIEFPLHTACLADWLCVCYIIYMYI